MSTELIISLITYAGVIAGAVSGALEAHRKQMDVVGACTVALITALGGGTLRDLLLGRAPVFWIYEESYAYLALLTALVTFYSTRLRTIGAKAILIPDALGLGVFSVLGAAFGLQSGTSWFVASLMGVITGIFGGVLRDVICNEIPSVFTPSTYLYATASWIGAWVFILSSHFGAAAGLASLLAILVTFGLRIGAVRFNWALPAPRTREP